MYNGKFFLFITNNNNIEQKNYNNELNYVLKVLNFMLFVKIRKLTSSIVGYGN